MSMLFRKKMPRSCTCCEFGTVLNEEEILCSKRGIVPADKGCRKFRYDPCKRTPVKAKSPDFSKYTPDDFSL